MGEFFRGWRRQSGCATLVMACVLMAGWVRSHRIGDEILLRVNNRTLHWFVSAGGWLGWATVTSDQGLPTNVWTYQSTSLGVGSQSATTGPFEQVPYIWNWNEFPHFIVPYAVFVIPLTLLSAYLLLSKPRKPEPEKAVEPRPVAGA